MIDNDDILVDLATSERRSYDLLFRFSRPYRLAFLSGIGLLTLGSALGVTGAYVLGLLVESLYHSTGNNFVWGAWVLALELGAVILAYYGRRILGFTATKALFDVREALFSKLTELPLRYFDTQPLGRIVTRVTHDVESLDDFFTGSFARLASAIITLLVVFFSMILTDFKLGLVMCLSAVPAFLVSVGIRKSIRHWNLEMAKKNSTINAQLSENLSGFSVIRAFGLENWTQKIFDQRVDEHLYVSLKFNIVNAWTRPIILFLCYLPFIVLVFWGAQKVFAGALTVGIFVAFMRYSERFSRPIIAIAQEIHMVQTAQVNMERIAKILAEETELDAYRKSDSRYSLTKEFTQLSNSLTFQDVWMRYGGENSAWSLKGVSFTVKRGEVIGLAGTTGSGKTTTLALLSRLYDFQKGEILLDGINIREFHPSLLRKKIAYVSQDVVIFKGTLLENIRAGKTVSDTHLAHVAESCGLEVVMKRRGLNWDSQILDHGANLSQGEKQLIALARVLTQDPEILILDEATAHIDPDLEKIIQTAVHRIMENRTCFLIAHRLKTLENCDRILVFKDGIIVEHGKQEDLFQSNGYFKALVSHAQVEK
jgi:ATP-binding cassette subfamily B multidrug efflux pump